MTDCATCAEMRAEIETLRWRLDKVIEQHDLAEQDIAHKRRQIAALKQQLAEKREQDPGKDVQDIFDYWIVACRKDPKRTILNAKRQQAIRKALSEGYSVEDIQRATVGLALDPFRKNGVVYDDIGVACRNVELYRDKADAIDQRIADQGGAVAEEARKTLTENCGRHYSKPHLPKLWSGGFEHFGHLLKMKGCDFRSVPGRGDRIIAQCPAHEDRKPSLDVREADDGRVLAICRSHGCTWEEICAALGTDGREFGPRGDHHIYGPPTESGRQMRLEAA